jgi:hypothetical protein
VPYIKAQVSSEDLLRLVEEMTSDELELFVKSVITIHARRNAKGLPHTEAELLQHINAAVPDVTLRRYRELIVRRQNEALTVEEHAELLLLSETLEQINVQRIGWLAALARLRGISLDAIMDELEIKPLAL